MSVFDQHQTYYPNTHQKFLEDLKEAENDEIRYDPEYEKLTFFLEASSLKNEWINFPTYHINVYIRKSNRFLDEQLYLDDNGYSLCLDLANFTVDEEYRGQGYFTQFLKLVEFVAHEYERTVFVESILNPRLEQFLLKRGYKPMAEVQLTPCLYLPYKEV